MSMTDRLIRQLGERGLRIEPGEKPGELRLVGNMRRATPEIMRAVTAFKPDLLARFGEGASGRGVSPETGKPDRKELPTVPQFGPRRRRGICRRGRRYASRAGRRSGRRRRWKTCTDSAWS